MDGFVFYGIPNKQNYLPNTMDGDMMNPSGDMPADDTMPATPAADDVAVEGAPDMGGEAAA